MALRGSRPSDGQFLTRSDKKELDPEVVQAAKDSLASGEAHELIYDTAAEAKGVMTKLRSYVNAQGQGLRASVRETDEGAVLQFIVSATKRDVTTKA